MSDLLRALSVRIDDPARAAYYARVGAFCLTTLDAAAVHPLVIGINGPQGCGKSVLARHLVDALGVIGVAALTLSIDDFYLTHDEQRALAERHPGNRTLEHRGYPGTHDVELGARALGELKAGLRTLLPVYDKTAHAGRGDRAPTSAWRPVEPPFDLVLFEGWMLGFEPVDDATLAPSMHATNAMLAEYAPWNTMLDAIVTLDSPSLPQIVEWRVDAERERRRTEGGGLSDDAARDYVERFLPAYDAYAPGVRVPRPERPTLSLTLGADRLPVA